MPIYEYSAKQSWWFKWTSEQNAHCLLCWTKKAHIFFYIHENNKSVNSFLHNVCKFKHCYHKFIKSFTKTKIASIEEKNVRTGKISAKMQNYFPFQMSWMMLMESCTLSISEIVSRSVALQSSCTGQSTSGHTEKNPTAWSRCCLKGRQETKPWWHHPK